MKVSENIKCSYCTDTVDSLCLFVCLFFAECPVVSEFLKFMEGFFLREFGIKIKLHSTDILFGVQRSNSHKKFIKKINHVLPVAKMCISIFKKTTTKKPAIFPGNICKSTFSQKCLNDVETELREGRSVYHE